MVNTTLTASIIAKAAVGILENELNMAGAVHRGYEDEFDKKVNGYSIGDTVTIRKPADFTVRTTIVSAAQDVQEGKLNLQINKVAGVDFKFTSQQLTLNISDLSERVIRPAMIQVAVADDLVLAPVVQARHRSDATRIVLKRGVVEARGLRSLVFEHVGRRLAAVPPAEIRPWAASGRTERQLYVVTRSSDHRELCVPAP